MRHLLERLGGYLPAALGLLLPIVFLPVASDSYILPRASIVIACACLGAGIALLVPGTPRLGALRMPLIAAAGAAVLAFLFSVSQPLGLAAERLGRSAVLDGEHGLAVVHEPPHGGSVGPGTEPGDGQHGQLGDALQLVDREVQHELC